MNEPIPLLFTAFQSAWAISWAWLHTKVRRNRKYSEDRVKVSNDSFYKAISPVLYLMQNGLCIVSFSSSAPWLLKFHDSDSWRALGAMLLIVGSTLYWWALKHLGQNYSPCYDSH